MDQATVLNDDYNGGGAPISPSRDEYIDFRFTPVKNAVILEITGYLSMGLADEGDPAEANVMYKANVLYKWTTWLHRMNDWLKNNAQTFPQYISMPPVKLPGNLYYMGEVKPQGSIDSFLHDVRTCALGPLLPQEFSSMLTAMMRGVNQAHLGNEQLASEKYLTYEKFLTGLNTIAQYAVSPIDTLASSAGGPALQATPATITIPVPPTTRYISDGSKTLIEKFTTVAKNTSPKKWFVILFAALIIYMLFKDEGSNSVSLQTGGTTWGPDPANFELPLALR